MKVLAGIVLYNPDINRLKQNIIAIMPQVDEIICIDNGSDNIGIVKKQFQKQVKIIQNNKNLGIAAALNKILEYAYNNGFEWFITLDQDSVCMSGLIENYKKYFDKIKNPAIISCTIKDRNFHINKSNFQGITEIDECITSASFCNSKALKSVCGFDNKMFIDCVDFDICLNLRNHGYKIYRTDYVGLLHEVGQGKNVKFFGKNKVVYNHSPVRNYYIARNHIYMAKKYPKDISMVKTFVKEIESEILIILYEENKIKKIMIRHKAIHDGMKLKMGVYS